MSSFLCEHCGGALIDTPTGYVTECPHYPHDKLAVFVLDEVVFFGRRHPADIKSDALHIVPFRNKKRCAKCLKEHDTRDAAIKCCGVGYLHITGMH